MAYTGQLGSSAGYQQQQSPQGNPQPQTPPVGGTGISQLFSGQNMQALGQSFPGLMPFLQMMGLGGMSGGPQSYQQPLMNYQDQANHSTTRHLEGGDSSPIAPRPTDPFAGRDWTFEDSMRAGGLDQATAHARAQQGAGAFGVGDQFNSQGIYTGPESASSMWAKYGQQLDPNAYNQYQQQLQAYQPHPGAQQVGGPQPQQQQQDHYNPGGAAAQYGQAAQQFNFGGQQPNPFGQLPMQQSAQQIGAPMYGGPGGMRGGRMELQ